LSSQARTIVTEEVYQNVNGRPMVMQILDYTRHMKLMDCY